jgi:hypothetical protein
VFRDRFFANSTSQKPSNCLNHFPDKNIQPSNHTICQDLHCCSRYLILSAVDTNELWG